MSTGMLGDNKALREFWNGPLLTLVERVNGPEGEYWLEVIKKTLRKENPFPEKLVRGKGKGPVKSSASDLPSFLINLGDGRTAEQLYVAGGYVVVDQFDRWAKDFVLSPEFKLSQTRERVELVYVQFDYAPTTDQVLARFNELDLDRPQPEDALRFGKKFPGEQMDNPVVFLHEPWRYPGGDLRVLVLNRNDSGRRLYCDWFDGQWSQQCRFVARRRNCPSFSPCFGGESFKKGHLGCKFGFR